MVRSGWQRSLVVALMWSGLAVGQQPMPSADNGGERLLKVQEFGKPEQRCRVLQSWGLTDGGTAFKVEDVSSGETMTIVESAPIQAGPTRDGGNRIQAMATRIFHWTSDNSPNGAPPPPKEQPAAVAANSPQQNMPSQLPANGTTADSAWRTRPPAMNPQPAQAAAPAPIDSGIKQTAAWDNQPKTLPQTAPTAAAPRPAVPAALAGSPTPAAPTAAAPVPEGNYRLVMVQESGKPDQKCRVLKVWTMQDGSTAQQVQAMDTGEIMTIVTTQTAPAPSAQAQAQGRHALPSFASRIFRWGRDNNPPAGAPTPPAVATASPGAAVAAKSPVRPVTPTPTARVDTRPQMLPAPASTTAPAARPTGTVANPWQGAAAAKPAAAPAAAPTPGPRSVATAVPVPAAPRATTIQQASVKPAAAAPAPRSTMLPAPARPQSATPAVNARQPAPAAKPLTMPPPAKPTSTARVDQRNQYKPAAPSVETAKATDWRSSWGKAEDHSVKTASVAQTNLRAPEKATAASTKAPFNELPHAKGHRSDPLSAPQQFAKYPLTPGTEVKTAQAAPAAKRNASVTQASAAVEREDPAGFATVSDQGGTPYGAAAPYSPVYYVPVPLSSAPAARPAKPGQPQAVKANAFTPNGYRGAPAAPAYAPMPMMNYAVPPVCLPQAMPMPVAQPEAVVTGGRQKEQVPATQTNSQALLLALRDALCPSERELAAQSLAEMDCRQSPQVVQALLNSAREDPAPTVRVACIHCLAEMRLNTVPMLSLLQSLESDGDPRVRHEAEQAMVSLGFRSPQAVQPASAVAPADSK